MAFLKLFARNKIICAFLNVEENSIILRPVFEKSNKNLKYFVTF